jgi:hypothetical protein
MSKNRIAKVKKFTETQEKKMEEILKSLEVELTAMKVKEIKLKYADK